MRSATLVFRLYLGAVLPALVMLYFLVRQKKADAAFAARA